MDLPLHRPPPTWRNSEFVSVTLEALGAYLIVLAITLPATLWMTIKLNLWQDLALDPRGLCAFVLKYSIWVLPYTWCYFLALRRLTRHP
jgi:hypothetical protein